MRLLFSTLFVALLLGSGCTAIPINLPKDDGKAAVVELGGGFDAGASDTGIAPTSDLGAADFGPLPYGDAGVTDGLLDGEPTDAVGEGQLTDAVGEGQLTDAVGEGQLTDAVGEGIVCDAQPPPTEGGALDDGTPEG